MICDCCGAPAIYKHTDLDKKPLYSCDRNFCFDTVQTKVLSGEMKHKTTKPKQRKQDANLSGCCEYRVDAIVLTDILAPILGRENRTGLGSLRTSTPSRVMGYLKGNGWLAKVRKQRTQLASVPDKVVGRPKRQV